MNAESTRPVQFSVNFEPVQDRLMFRSGLDDGTEIQLLFTRRIVKGLVDLVDRAAAHLVDGGAADPVSQARLADFSREAAVQQGDFSQEYRPAPAHPMMADGPRLVRSARLTPRPDGSVDLVLGLDGGGSLTFTLESDHLWCLVDLLMRRAAAAGWGLEPPREALEDAPDRLVN